MHCGHADAGRLKLRAPSHSQPSVAVAAAARVHGGEDELQIVIQAEILRYSGNGERCEL
jgi:hypothetical protein